MTSSRHVRLYGRCVSASLMESLWYDLRFALRVFRRSPGFTCVAVLSLSLGIGANTAIFSLIHAVLIRNLPVPQPKHLVLVDWEVKEWPGALRQSGFGGSLSYGAFQAVHSRTDIVDGFFGFAPFGFDPANTTVKFDGHSTLLDGSVVTGDYFSTLGVHPVLGRTIGPEDELRSSPRVAVLNYDDWQHIFSGATDVVGKSILVNGSPAAIVGVAPPGFDGLLQGQHTDIWVSLGDGGGIYPYGTVTPNGEPGPLDNHVWFWITSVARLKPGISQEQAKAALNVTFQQFLRSDVMKTVADSQLPHIEFKPAAQGINRLANRLEDPLALVQGIVALVLLIACANLAGLLLARAAERQNEIGIRLALGARRRQIVRQLLIEALLIAFAGAVAGLAIALWGARALLLLFTAGQTVSLNVSLEPAVLAFAAALAIATTLLFALVPALRATRLDVNSAVKGSVQGAAPGFERRSWLRSVLVCTQVALSLLLMTGAGLFLRTLRNLEAIDLGFNRENVLIFGINPSELGYSDTKLVSTYVSLLDHLDAIPGVRSATASGLALISGWINNGPVSVDNPPSNPKATSNIYTNSVGPRFFETMGIALILGRPIDRGDLERQRRVAVINSTMAHQIWGDANPLGRRFSSGNKFDPAKSYEVIGVAQDAKFANVREKFHASTYVPFSQVPWKLGQLYFEVRSAGEPSAIASAVRVAVRSTDANLVPFQMKTQSVEIYDSLATPRLFAKLSSIFGLLAISLAAVGLFGLLSYLVTQRTHEIGIRMALGAQRTDILGVVLRSVGWVVATGALVGGAGALVAARVLRSYWYGVEPSDPVTVIAAAACLCVVAIVACWIPARRAARVDPMVALRHE